MVPAEGFGGKNPSKKAFSAAERLTGQLSYPGVFILESGAQQLLSSGTAGLGNNPDDGPSGQREGVTDGLLEGGEGHRAKPLQGGLGSDPVLRALA